MSHISVKEALEKIFKDSEKPSEVIKQVSDEDVVDLEIALRKMCNKVYKSELQKKGQEIIDWSPQGQWKIEKAIKPGPTLDYNKINPDRSQMPNDKVARASKYAEIEANAPSIDYQSDRMAAPKVTEGAAAKAARVRAKIAAEREIQSKESALDTIARRSGKPIGEPATPKTPLAPSHPSMKPMKKNEMPGVPTMTSSAVAMSEKEPHHDDPKHEDKEKKKVEQIKDHADDILDMHKADKESRSVFQMDHANKILDMNHADAKSHLHGLVDASNATAGNKAKIKSAIEGTKNVKQLSGLVANHVLAAGGGGTKTGELKVIR